MPADPLDPAEMPPDDPLAVPVSAPLQALAKRAVAISPAPIANGFMRLLSVSSDWAWPAAGGEVMGDAGIGAII
jgi:hypothetical protein